MRRDDHRIFDVPFRYPPYTTFGLKVFRSAVVNGPSFTSITFGQFLSRVFVGSAVVAGVAAGVYYGVK